MEKKCHKCREAKDSSYFAKDSSRKDGLCDKCKVCMKDYKSTYYQKNKGALLSKQKEYNSRNYEKIRNRKRVHYSLNKEEILSKQKEYSNRNSEKLRARRKAYWAKNRHNLVKAGYFRKKTRMQADVLFLEKQRIGALIRNAFLRTGRTKAKRTEYLLGCTIVEFLARIGQRPDGYVLDHICPVAQGKTLEEIEKLQHYSNLRWLSTEENVLKGDKKTPEGEALCKSLLGREWIA